MRNVATKSKEKSLGQVLTPPNLASRLAQSFSGPNKTWLELGIGSGRIAQACIDQLQPKLYLGVDIDSDILATCHPFACTQLIQADVLNTSLLHQVIGDQKFDCVVGNPPYGLSPISYQAQERLSYLCPNLPSTSLWGQLDLFFVLESLSKLKRPGQAAFIVSSTLIENYKFKSFREQLLSEASEIECYELPLSTFKGKAEVRSFLLILRYTSTKTNNCQVIIGKIDGEQFNIVDQQIISVEEGISNLNFSHHRFLQFDATLRKRRNCVPLNELGVKISRGSKSKSEFNHLGITHFHLSDFPNNSTEIHSYSHFNDRFKSAQPGDILIPRVGSRCLTRQAIMIKGSIPFTDSIYRLQLPANHRHPVLSWLSSAEGQIWRELAAQGSCAKHLTLKSLLSMPIC